MNKVGMGIFFILQGIITLGVMVVIPIGWFFFGWVGPVEALLGKFFLWSIADAVLWMLVAMVAMFCTAALGKVIERLSVRTRS